MADDTENVAPASGLSSGGFGLVSRREVAAFARELSILIDVGMPLLKALKLMSERATNAKLSGIIREVAGSVERGNSLASSLANYPKVFSSLFFNIVKVGEVGGVLDQSLRRLANFLEEENRLRGKIFYAMLYPCMVVLVCLAVLIVILTYVIPVFLNVFKEGDVELPLPTKIVEATGNFISGYWPLLVGLLVILIILFFAFRKTPAGRKVIDTLKLRTPILGRLGVKIVLARVTGTFATLIKSGIPILNSIKIVAQTSNNTLIEEAFSNAAEEVEKGGNLSASLGQAGIIPPVLLDMINIGEEAGALDVVLEKASNNLQEEVDNTLEGLTAILEPLLVIIMGLVVLFVAVAVFLPYMRLDQAIL